MVYNILYWFLSLFSTLAVAGTDDALDAKLGLFMRKGDASFNAEQYSEAAMWFEQVTQGAPKHARAFTMLAAANYMSGALGSAIKNFDKALELDPTSTDALMRSGQLHLQVCDLQRADRDFSGALKVQPRHAAAQKGHANVQRLQSLLQEAQAIAKQGDWSTLVSALEPVTELASDCMEAHLLLAQHSLQNGDFEGCSMATGRVLKVQQSHTQALLLRGAAFFKLEDFDTAKRHVGMVLTQYDPDSTDAQQQFRSIKDYQKKVSKLRLVIDRQNWTDIEEQVSSGVAGIDAAHTKLRAELNGALAKALLHLGRHPDVVAAVADAALQYGFDEELLALKVQALQKHARYEAAVQLCQMAMQKHGRTQRLQQMLQEAAAAARRSKLKDYYGALGVDRNIDEKTLKRVYRKLALQYHPDKVVSQSEADKEAAQHRFAEITEAYEVLSDPDKRALHDNGQDPFEQGGGGGHRGGFQGGSHFNFGGQRFTFNL